MNDETGGEDRTAGYDEAVDVEAVVCEFERLKQEIEENPGSAAFPRLAEAYRRAGQVEQAWETAQAGLSAAPERLGGNVALALAMIDRGEIALASRELQKIFQDVPDVPQVPQPLASPSEALPRFENDAASAVAEAGELRSEEIDEAFAVAETQRDEMVSANTLAAAALRAIEDDNGHPSQHPVFATVTMADLLEEQGDVDGAQRVRVAIDETRDSGAPATATALGRQRVVARLEGWLENLGRGSV